MQSTNFILALLVVLLLTTASTLLASKYPLKPWENFSYFNITTSPRTWTFEPNCEGIYAQSRTL